MSEPAMPSFGCCWLFFPFFLFIFEVTNTFPKPLQDSFIVKDWLNRSIFYFFYFFYFYFLGFLFVSLPLRLFLQLECLRRQS